MKKGIEYFKKLQEDNEKKIADAEIEHKNLRARHDELETRISEAIANDNNTAAEKLLRDRFDIDVKIELAEKKLSYLQSIKPDRKAISEAWREDCNDYQRQIDIAEKEYHQMLIQACKKALAIADIANNAWKARKDALSLVGDKEPTSINAGNGDFEYNTIHATVIRKALNIVTSEELKLIRIDAISAIENATTERVNPFFRFADK